MPYIRAQFMALQLGMPRKIQQAPLFDSGPAGSDPDRLEEGAPLAARMRPRNFDEYVGQDHLAGESKILRRLVEAQQLPSIILDRKSVV